MAQTGNHTAHTPGNWMAWRAPTGEWAIRSVYHDEHGRRCTAFPAICNAGAQDNEANARLIAAAPELLAMLKDIRKWMDEDLSAWEASVIPEIDALIARAEGR